MKALAENLWIAEQCLPHPEFKLPFLKMKNKMTVVRLQDGGLLVHSPIRLTAELRQELKTLGELRYVMVPNLFHHLFVLDYLALEPKPTLMAPVSIRRKRPDLPVAQELPQALAPLRDDLVGIEVAGHRADETVLYHPASKTLVVTDLAYNITDGTGMERAWFRIFGKLGSPCLPVYHRLAVTDRKQLRRALDQILELDFERLIVGHGDIIERQPREAFRTLWRWI